MFMGKNNIHTVFRSIYNYKMDHNQRIDFGERYAERRPEKLTEKYKNKSNKHCISLIFTNCSLTIFE